MTITTGLPYKFCSLATSVFCGLGNTATFVLLVCKQHSNPASSIAVLCPTILLLHVNFFHECWGPNTKQQVSTVSVNTFYRVPQIIVLCSDTFSFYCVSLPRSTSCVTSQRVTWAALGRAPARGRPAALPAA